MTRIRYGVALGVIALALAAASPVLAGDQPQKEPNAAEVRNEVRVEMNAAGPGQEPKVRMWVNGKEVEPGDDVAPGVVGRLHAESIGDPGEGKAKTHTRIEVQPGGPDGQGRVRMWINGKEVDPGDAVRIGDGKARVQIRAVPSEGDEEGEEAERGGPAGALGVRVAPLGDDLAREVGVEEGVAVTGVIEGSPAARIGLREGDVITAVDDAAVRGPEALLDRVGRHRPGERVRIAWRRPGAAIEATVKLASRDDLIGEEGRRAEERERGEGEAVRPPEPRPRGEMWDELMERWRGQMREWQRRRREGDAPPRPPRLERPEPPRDEGDREDREETEERPGGFLGILAAPLNDDIRDIAGADEGVLINSLTDDSPAAKAGLKPGDVIVRIDDAEIHAVDHLVEALLGRRAGQRIHVVYFRMGKRRETDVTLGRRPGEAEAREQEGVPLLEDLFGGEMPDLREYLEGLRPQMEEWARQFQEQQGRGGAGDERPGEAERRGPGRGDLDRLMERLDRLERRLDQMEKRLDREER